MDKVVISSHGELILNDTVSDTKRNNTATVFIIYLIIRNTSIKSLI